MAIQEYVRSIVATDTVSKAEVFRFLEMRLTRADRNHDGMLDVDELAVFVQTLIGRRLCISANGHLRGKRGWED